MTLLFELVSSLVGLVTQPFSLVKLCCVFGIRSIGIISQTCVDFLRAAIYFNLIIFWRFALWGSAILSLPLRVITALHRERQLEMQLLQMTTELENVLWDVKELEDKLDLVIREREMLRGMLRELEDEHDEAIDKIKLLEGEIKELKDENEQLKEIQGKSLWDYKGQSEMSNGHSIKADDKFSISSRKIGDSVQTAAHKDLREYDTRDIVKAAPETRGIVQPYTAPIVSEDLERTDILARRRVLALSRSLFSAALSLVVGMIVWEAEDPCTPLIVALLVTVSMSLMSVVQFLWTIENKPASDAVTLLSFNWFILGILTYPTLPSIIPLLAPLASTLLTQLFAWLSL